MMRELRLPKSLLSFSQRLTAFSENAANRGAANIQLSFDRGSAESGAIQSSDLGGMRGHRCRAARPFPVLPGVGKASVSQMTS